MKRSIERERIDATGHIELSASQKLAKQQVFEIIDAFPKEPIIIIIEGFSGVGKTVVMNEIAASTKPDAAQVVSPEDFIYESKTLNKKSKTLIVSQTLGDFDSFEKIAAEKYPKFTTMTVTLNGFTKQEIEDFITNNRHPDSLETELVAHLSLGIPYLSQQLLTPNLTVENASRITAKFLSRSFRKGYRGSEVAKLAKPYLQTVIPESVLKNFPEIHGLSSSNVYDDLLYVLDNRRHLQEETIDEPSPLFIAPESEKIYDDFLKSAGFPGLNIFVPNLSDSEFQIVSTSLGLDDSYRYYDGAPRFKMFGATFRKVAFWTSDSAGETNCNEGESNNFELDAKAYLRALQQGKLKLRKVNKEGEAKILLHAHEHSGLPHNPAAVGWATESLLQQLNIAYFVNNYACKISYSFNPLTKHISNVGPCVEINRWG